MGTGTSRTHDFFIENNSRRVLAEYNKLFVELVLAVVPPSYLTATGAMLHLQPYNPEKVPEVEKQISEAFDSYVLNQDFYGWYGEFAYGPRPNTYVAAESRWFDSGCAA